VIVPRDSTPHLLTVNEVARVLHQSRSTVYRKLKTGDLEAVRLGDPPKAPLRVSAEALWSYVNRGSRHAA
jgi:excisionase family DNA binding protein